MLAQPKNITKQSGVYLYKNGLNEIIYIGKAKVLSDRIKSYFNNPDELKNQLILQEATAIETITTNSELEALYLEAELIQKYQPKFNQLLKDGNPFVYLLFTKDTIPTIEITRTTKKKGTYIGPFLYKKTAYSVFNYLVEKFQLKLCNKKLESGCLEFHIGICSGNCTNSFDKSFYLQRLELAKQLLLNNSKKAFDQINNDIQQASKELNFERAKNLLQYRNDLEHILFTIKKLCSKQIKKTTKKDELLLPLLLEIQRKLNLKHIPYVIDCFDISHMQGQSIVGSCIRYVHGQPAPSLFRKFIIKTLTNQNDFAALAEIVQRRYKKENDYPNLIIVDGGKGQINAIKPYVGDAEMVGLAKREETIISSNFDFVVKLEVTNQADALLLQIRDKTHQFAISFHRKRNRLTV